MCRGLVSLSHRQAAPQPPTHTELLTLAAVGSRSAQETRPDAVMLGGNTLIEKMSQQVVALLEKLKLPTSWEALEKSDKNTKLVVYAGAGKRVVASGSSS